MEKPLVIKIGGSLLSHAGPIIRTILNCRRTILILPGGGIFADTVRSLQAGGTTAHWMAIAGMEQYGWYLSSFGIETVEIPEFREEPRIFLPYRYLLIRDPLPHSWEITSDTISAWLASEISADLLILKSLDQIRADNKPVQEIRNLVSTDDLDPAFIPFILKHELSGLIINGSIPERIRQALQGLPVTGTRFGITI
jgi:aspartokinase-like uncharacterized kinase